MHYWKIATILLLAVVCFIASTSGMEEKKGKFCAATIMRDNKNRMFFDVGTVLPQAGNYGYDDSCYYLECQQIKKKRKLLVAIAPQSTMKLGQCDVCTEAGVQYPLGTVKRSKHSLPAPCYSEVCTYEIKDNTFFPPGPPKFQNFGHACDCPSPTSTHKPWDGSTIRNHSHSIVAVHRTPSYPHSIM